MKLFVSLIVLLSSAAAAFAQTAGRPIVKGSVDQTTYIRIIDSTDGTPETAVTSATSGIDLEYVRLGGSPADLTETDLGAANSAHSDGGMIHVGGGNYRVDLPDAAVASSAGVNEVIVQGTITGMIVIPARHALVAVDPYDAVRGGMTALPNANAAAAGGLPTNGTGSGQIDLASGRVDVGFVADTAQTGGDIVGDTNDIQTKVGVPVDLGDGASLSGMLNAMADDGGGGAYNRSTDALEVLRDTLDTIESQTDDIGTFPNLGSGATLGGNLEDMRDNGTATYSRANHSLQALRDRGDAAWITASGFSTPLASGTAQAGSATTIQLAAAHTFANDILNGALVKIQSGTGAGQSRVITAYVGATDTATITPNWTQNPASDSVYEIVPASANLSALALSGTAAGEFAEAWDQDATGGSVRYGQVDFGGAWNVTGNVNWAGNFTIQNGIGVTRTDPNSPAVAFVGSGTGAGLHLASTGSGVGLLGTVDDLRTLHLDKFFLNAYNSASEPGNAAGWANILVENDGGVPRYTVNALEQAPAGGGGGGTDWNADERTALRTILGVPASGSTPADPSDGILDDIRDDIEDADDFGEAMDAQGYTSERAEFLDNLLGGGVVPTDLDDEAVPKQRTWTLADDGGGGLRDRVAKSLKIGPSPTFGVDFAADLPPGGRIHTVDLVEIASGTPGGVTFGTAGKEDGVAKFRITGVTAGTYSLRVRVTYDSGATQFGLVTLKVIP
jgi:hypothetical protein